MGYDISHRLEQEPLLRILWEEYHLCRAQQYVVFRIPEDSSGKREKIVTILFPSHIATWPCEGGLRDQPYLVLQIFAAFLQGEREGVLRSIR